MSDTDTATAMPGKAGKQRKKIAVIDGNSLMHRAYHAIRQPMSAPDGRATNALFGFFNMFIKMVETFHPDGIICAFDKGKPKVRMEILPQYKAQRPPMDKELYEQFPMVKELLKTLDIPVCEAEGWEGDDILGTLAKQGEEQGYDMYLVTGDRDIYQLATDHVKVVSTKKGVSEVSVMTPESVDDLYHGITPDLVPDFYGLKGDSSDNIPGVPGIGPKKAAALIVKYGSLDQVLAHKDEVKGKMGENLRAHVDDALLSRKVATIRTDTPIDINLADAKFPTFDAAEVERAFGSLGFTGIVKRLVRLGGVGAQTGVGKTETTMKLPKVLNNEKGQQALEQAFSEDDWIGVALEQQTEGKQLKLALDKEEETPLWFSTGKNLIRLSGKAALNALTEIVNNHKFAAGNVKELLHLICPMDSKLPAAIDAYEVDSTHIFDIAVAAYLLRSEGVSYQVRDVYGRYVPNSVLLDATDAYPEAALEAFAARALVDPLTKAMKEQQCIDLFTDLEMPLLPVLTGMERTGLYVDCSVFKSQSEGLNGEIEQVVEDIYAKAGEEFNIDSPRQLSHILFDVLKLPTAGLKKTRSGFYSTNAEVMSSLAKKSDLVQEVLDYRERNKIKSTYLDALPNDIRTDGRIHTTLNQTVAATGRLSSSDPNLQNIPTRSELGHRVRLAFTAPESHVFLTCDYSQIELRLLAHLSEDEHLIEAFRSGADFHAMTASRVFNIPMEQVTPNQRRRAKAVNFGIVYGQQAYGLANSLKIPRSEAQEMIDRYFEVYPGVRTFLDRCIKLAQREGYAITLYGRRRYTPDIASSNFQKRSFAERVAMNHPMQGTAADIIKMAMVEVPKRIRKEGMKSKLILQIHDELDFEVPRDEIDALSALVKDTMEHIVELKVPLIAEVSYGDNWAEAK